MKVLSLLFAATIIQFAAESQCAFAEDPTPGYNTKIPEGLLTPDKYPTRVGDIEFFDGIPTASTAEALYNHLDYIRGVQTFLSGMPAASLEAIRRSQAVDGKTHSNHAVIFDDLMDSNPLFLTGNTDTVYLSIILDLEKDGATVIEVPPGTGPGTVNDAFFRFVVDTGPPGLVLRAVSNSYALRTSGVQNTASFAGLLFLCASLRSASSGARQVSSARWAR